MKGAMSFTKRVLLTVALCAACMFRGSVALATPRIGFGNGYITDPSLVASPSGPTILENGPWAADPVASAASWGGALSVGCDDGDLHRVHPQHGHHERPDSVSAP